MRKFVFCFLALSLVLFTACSDDDAESGNTESVCYYCEMINYVGTTTITDGSGSVCIDGNRLDIKAGFAGQIIDTEFNKTPEDFIAELTANGAQCVLEGEGVAVCYECIGVVFNELQGEDAILCAEEGVVSFEDAAGNSLGNNYSLNSSFEDFIKNIIEVNASCTKQ